MVIAYTSTESLSKITNLSRLHLMSGLTTSMILSYVRSIVWFNVRFHDVDVKCRNHDIYTYFVRYPLVTLVFISFHLSLEIMKHFFEWLIQTVFSKSRSVSLGIRVFIVSRVLDVRISTSRCHVSRRCFVCFSGLRLSAASPERIFSAYSTVDPLNQRTYWMDMTRSHRNPTVSSSVRWWHSCARWRWRSSLLTSLSPSIIVEFFSGRVSRTDDRSNAVYVFSSSASTDAATDVINAPSPPVILDSLSQTQRVVLTSPIWILLWISVSFHLLAPPSLSRIRLPQLCEKWIGIIMSELIFTSFLEGLEYLFSWIFERLRQIQ